MVVSELLDYIRQGGSENGKPTDELITFHPLQAFNPVCFSGESPRLFSYSQENRRAAEDLSEQSSCLPSDRKLKSFTKTGNGKEVTVGIDRLFPNSDEVFLK